MASHDIKSIRRLTAGGLNSESHAVPKPRTDMDERRSEERIEVSLETVWDGTGSKRLSARITDLSEGGCFVDTTGEAQIGERLTVRIELPDGGCLELTGEVAHEWRPIGFGLRFIDLSDEQREQLRSFLTSLKGPNDPVPATFR